jgi:hypothetical protein
MIQQKLVTNATKCAQNFNVIWMTIKESPKSQSSANNSVKGAFTNNYRLNNVEPTNDGPLLDTIDITFTDKTSTNDIS